MNIAFVTFDGMTALDFIGIYDPVTRLKTMGFMSELQWDICAPNAPVRDRAGLTFNPTCIGKSLAEHDMVIVPGGLSTRELIHDQAFISWLRTAQPSRFKVSVCTGALLLGAAGFLAGKRATTHRTAYADLRAFCTVVEDRRVVDEGTVITAGGVSASIDLGLYLCDKLAGNAARNAIALQMEYEYGVETYKTLIRHAN